MMKDVTVVIVTLNEEENIADCIISVRKNGVERIILVDASSKDKTMKIARSLGAECYIVPRSNIATQRQHGVDLVKTKYVCLVDADNRLEADCISLLINYLEKGSFVGVAAQKFRLKGMKDYWSMGFEWHNKNFLFTPGEKMVIGTPAVYITEVIKKIRYDTSLISADDNTLCYRLGKHGLKVGAGPGICREKMASTFRLFKRKLLGYGKGDAEFFLSNPPRRLSMGTHMLRNYFIRGQLRAIKKGRFDLIPFYIIYSAIRYYGFLKALFEIRFLEKNKKHPGYE